LLFVHKHFPGQFLNLARAYAAQPGNEVVFITTESGFPVEGIRTVQCQPSRTSTGATHHYVQSFENAVLLGQSAYRAAEALRRDGFIPDLIYAHAGFGPGLYMREAFPDTPIIGHFEWFYRARNSDSDFLSQSDVTGDDALRIRTKNAGLLLELAQCDYGICPTAFQSDQFPPEYAGKLQVIHEGVDTGFFSPGVRGQLTIGDLHLAGDTEIVTYATRGMEPYRGFPQFMRSLVHLQQSRPHMHAVIAGDDSVCYGKPHGGGNTNKH
jgi:glycosyltransferase involved in cell wall biosynthesis